MPSRGPSGSTILPPSASCATSASGTSSAAAGDIPGALVEQLGAGGKLVLPLGPRKGTQYIVKLTKAEDGALTREDLIAVRFVPLLPGQAQEL